MEYQEADVPELATNWKRGIQRLWYAFRAFYYTSTCIHPTVHTRCIFMKKCAKPSSYSVCSDGA